MMLLKKLIFAPFFIAAFFFLIYQLSLLLKSYDFIFSLSISTLIGLITVATLLVFSSLLFSIFSCLANDWRLILPVGILSSLIPFIFLETSLAIVFTVAILISLMLTYLNLNDTLKNYLTFQPASLLGPPIRHLCTLLIISFCLVFFLSASKQVATNGFQIPDSLLDTAIKFAGTPQGETPQPIQPSLTAEQIELLKQNPDLLKQNGLDPKILDNLNKPSQTPTQISQEFIKQTVKDQLENFLKPYLGFIPALLAIILFLTLQSLTSFINLLIYPLLWIIFYIFEKSGFIKFTIENRPVKKMVI